jgi:hypothetical protein
MPNEKKGTLTAVLFGLLFLPNHPVVSFVIAIVTLAFWTGAVGVRVEREKHG